MPSTFSPLKIQLMATGENNTTWGDVTNLNLGTALEEAIVGSADVTFASADVTLTLTDTNASQTARNMRLRCTGTTGGSTRNLIVPSIEKPYIVKNDCADSVVVKTAAGTGITVPAGKTMWVYTDATNVVDATTHLSSLTLGTDLAVSDGGTGASTFTANGVIYGNTTSALLATAAGTTGQVLVGNTGGAPSWATLTGIGVTSFSAGTTGLTPNTATTGAITLAGTLGVANGGTGTATAFTAGSVVFAGASGVYSQDNANFFWDDTNNRLGIGTATPGARLDVVGDFRTTGIATLGMSATTTIATIGDSGTTNTRIIQFGRASAVTDIVNIQGINAGVGAADISLQASGGNVGIGTSSPGAKLDVNGEVRIYPASSPAQMRFGVGGAEKGKLSVDTSSNMAFETAGSERMRINSSGNVGIGVTPSTWTDYTALQVGALGGAALAGTVNNTFLSSNAYYNSGFKYAATGAGATYYQQTSSEHRFFNAPSGTAGNAISFTQAMTLDASGNLFVGGTTGNGRITARGAGTTGSTYSFEAATSGGATRFIVADNGESSFYNSSSALSMRIDSSGNVGIGTATPDVFGRFYTRSVGINSSGTSMLQINGTTYGGIDLGFNGTRTATMLAETGGLFIQTVTAAAMSLGTNGLERMRIDTSGNVGIGTSSPADKLTVNGFITTTAGAYSSTNGGNAVKLGAAGQMNFGAGGSDLILATNAGNIRFGDWNTNTERMRIDSSGNVGIGTSSPGAKLDVNGGNANTEVRFNYADNTPGRTVTLRMASTSNASYTGAGAYMQAIQGAGVDVYSLAFGTTQGSTSATERMRIDSSGNVGIGTASPGGGVNDRLVTASGSSSAAFQANGGSVTTQFGSTSAGWGLVNVTSNNPLLFSTNNTERMRIDGSGNVGIGTSSPTQRIDVVTSVSGNLASFRTTAGGGQGILLGVDTTNSLTQFKNNTGGGYGMAFYSGGGSSESMRIDNNGNLLVGTTTAGGKLCLQVAPTGTGIVQRWASSGGTAEYFEVNSVNVGSITTTTTATAYVTSSDVRLKHDIIDAPDAASLIDALQVRSFKWNADNSEQRYGFVAQELVTVAPEAVSQPEDPDDMMGVDYSKLVPMLVKEIQSLRARVAQLEGN